MLDPILNFLAQSNWSAGRTASRSNKNIPAHLCDKLKHKKESMCEEKTWMHHAPLKYRIPHTVGRNSIMFPSGIPVHV
jgi:hypothetical protein